MSNCRGVGVFFLVSFALGQSLNPQASFSLGKSVEEEPSKTYAPIAFNVTDKDVPSHDGEAVGVCFLGDMPSALCSLRCFWQGKTAQCDDESRCYCQDIPRDDDEPAASVTFTETNPNLVGVCVFSGLPSVTCKLRCFWRGQSAVCDKESNCWCQDEDDEVIDYESHPEPTSANCHNSPIDVEDDAEESSPGLVLYVIHWFTPEDDTASNTTGVDKVSSDITRDAWSIPHILAVVILIFFVILVLLEFALFCARRRNFTKHDLQTILSPPTLEKVNANGKL